MRPHLPSGGLHLRYAGGGRGYLQVDDSRARRDLCDPVMRLLGTSVYTTLALNRFKDFWRE
jgi:hypothetical protein